MPTPIVFQLTSGMSSEVHRRGQDFQLSEAAKAAQPQVATRPVPSCSSLRFNNHSGIDLDACSDSSDRHSHTPVSQLGCGRAGCGESDHYIVVAGGSVRKAQLISSQKTLLNSATNVLSRGRLPKSLTSPTE